MKKRMDQKILIWIDKELLASLDEFKNKKGWTRSFTIREAIKSYINMGETLREYVDLVKIKKLKTEKPITRERIRRRSLKEIDKDWK